jgi:hypothetical protein
LDGRLDYQHAGEIHYILNNTDEDSELRNFMAAHWEHVDDLFIFKEFLKPITIDDCKILPSKFQEEKRYERRLKIKNIRKPDNDISTGIRCYEKIKKPIVALFYYHILEGLNNYLDDATCNFPHSRIPFYANYIIKGGEKFYEMYDNILNGNYFEPIEPPHFENTIMDEHEEKIYFENLSLELVTTRKD